MGEGPWIAMAGAPDRPRATDGDREARLHALRRLVETRQGDALLGPVRVQDGRLTLVLGGDAEPFRLVLLAGLQPGLADWRWAVVTNAVQAAQLGQGAARRRALQTLAELGARGGRIGVRTGNPSADELLAQLAAALVALLDGLTDRQREVGALLLVDGLRRSEIAARLGISRPTVSVMVDRARLLELDGVARGLDRILRAAVMGGPGW